MDTYERLLHGFVVFFVVTFVAANVTTMSSLRTSGIDDTGPQVRELQDRLSQAVAIRPQRSTRPSSAPIVIEPEGDVDVASRKEEDRLGRVRDITVSQRQGQVLLTLYLEGQRSYAVQWEPASRMLSLDLMNTSADGVSEVFPPLSIVNGLEVAAGQEDSLTIKLELVSGVELDPDSLDLEGSADRIDLVLASSELDRPAGDGAGRLIQTERDSLGEGLVYERHRYTNVEGAGSDVHVLRLDLASREFALEHELGQETIRGRERVSGIAERTQAIAAINASFFAGDGSPLGLVAQGRRLLSVPIHRRTSFGSFRGSMALMGNPGFSGFVETRSGKFFLQGVNQRGHDGSVIVYTPEYATTTGSSGAGLEVAITDSRVVALHECDSPIPSDGFVVGIRGAPPEAMASAEFWDEVEYRYGLTPPWDVADFAVGGGPRLLADGEIQVTWQEERFAKSLVYSKAPRTSVGIGEAGEVIMVVVDGRDAPRNAGVSLNDLARIMQRLGCRDAMNLDGGGSTGMWVRDRLVNRPSDGRERAVSSALIVRRRLPLALARRPVDGADVQGS